MRAEMVEGLSRFSEDDLTTEELEQLDIERERIEDEAAAQNNDLQALLGVLGSDPEAPKEYDLEGWKDNFGQIHVSSVLGEEDIYIWRTIKRLEYKQMLKSGALNESYRAEESIVRKCLLYPKPTEMFLSSSPAGVVSTLKEQIMHKSGFVPEQMALMQIKVL